MRCGYCKEIDVTIEHVKAHAEGGKFTDSGMKEVTGEPQWPASDKQINYVIGLQAERNLPEYWTAYDEPTLRKLERDEVSGIITMLKSFTRKVANDPHYDSGKVDLPAGRYALLRDSEPWGGSMGGADATRWFFYEVQDGKGRWAGYKFIKRLIGAPGDYQKVQMNRAERDIIFKEIMEVGAERAMVNYGLQSGVCGRCASPLTDPESLKRGIGPVCAQKLGW